MKNKKQQQYASLNSSSDFSTYSNEELQRICNIKTGNALLILDRIEENLCGEYVSADDLIEKILDFKRKIGRPSKVMIEVNTDSYNSELGLNIIAEFSISRDIIEGTLVTLLKKQENDLKVSSEKKKQEADQKEETERILYEKLAKKFGNKN
jgi:hypothetical protein